MRQAAAQEHRTIRNRYQARLCPNEQGKKLKSEQAYPKPPHLPWQLHPGGGNCYLARASRANTTCGCLRPEPRVHYGLHPAYCYPIFFFLFILFRYSVIDSYPYLLTTFVVMQQKNTRISTSGCCSLRITLCSRRCLYNAVLVPPAACKTSRTSAQAAARRQVLGTRYHLGEPLLRTQGRPVRIRMVLAAVAFSWRWRAPRFISKAHAPWAPKEMLGDGQCSVLVSSIRV
ncbi:hypothetical protein HDV63DRAFT_319384 [Trichoderma sp. SZMC 28014]